MPLVAAFAIDFAQDGMWLQAEVRRVSIEAASCHIDETAYGHGRWHALIDCYGQHRRPVTHSNWLLWPTPQACGTL